MAADRPQAQGTEQIRNDRVIVTEWRFPVGAETGWHRHEHDYVVVPLLDGTLIAETADGARNEVQLEAGVSYARPEGVEHNIINGNDFEFRFVEVEIRDGDCK